MIASREFTIITPTPSSNNGDENSEHKYNSYALYQSATSKDEQQLYDATVVPSSANHNNSKNVNMNINMNVNINETVLPIPSMAMNVSSGNKQVTFGNTSKYSPQSTSPHTTPHNINLGDDIVSPRSVTSTNTSNTNASSSTTAFSSTSVSSQNSIPSVHTPISPALINNNNNNHNNNNHNNNNNKGHHPPSPSPSPSPWSRPRLNNQQSSTSFKKSSSNHKNDGGPFQMQYNIENNNESSAELKVNQSMNVRNNSNRSGNGLKIRSSDVATCPNLVNKKCRCKEILQQNPSAQKIWSGCYRVSIANKNQHYDNREIDIAFFDGLYHGLCKYFQYEVDTDRIPTKKDIAIIIKNHKGFVIDGKNGLGIDRCHFVEFWKWFRGCCDIVKDIYRVWDTQYPFQMEIFVNRKKCEQVLQDTPDGMYILLLYITLCAVSVIYI